MNKIAIALSAALSLGAIASANAADATINFTGEIKDLTCTITVGAGGTGTTVTMPTVSSNVINGGVGAREQAFTLNVGAAGSTECGAGDYIFSFQGKNVEDGRLKNTETGGAANVQLAILDGGAEADLMTHTITKTIPAGGGSTTIPLTARYEKSSAGSAGEGDFATALEISVNY
ncbi:fimbrial protein [Stenotrophomonas forensis]|uniref:fimbrial protein n=1 Tax=Stenotrophomonas forensis TaxID=2871169 RepID=UPI0018D40B67|nr:type 1 fimbrial protein [Stenotrophomonas maltophilia]MBH1599829.1 type 1 fimbrial protein [Stenotrophomonas maltophilia]